MASLARLDYPRDRFEVIVVDDGGDIPLDATTAPFHSRLTLTLHRQANAGPASARNRGASLAQGPYLAFTDDDCAPAPDWLARLAERFEDAPRAMLGGRTINALPRNPFAEASQVLISYLYAYERQQPGGMGFVASNNIALPLLAQVATGVGFFQEALQPRPFLRRVVQ
ncbi:MAG: glycosyltransferase [Rhodothermales bacterium]